MKHIKSKSLLLFICIICFSSDLWSQKFGGAQISYGLSSTTFGFESGKETHLGKSIMVEGRLASRYLYLGLGLQYKQLSITREVISTTSPIFKNRADIHIFKIPVSIGILPVNQNWFRVKCFAGAGVNIITNVDDNTIPITLSSFENASMFYHIGTGVEIKFITLDYVFEKSFGNFINTVNNSVSTTNYLRLGFYF